MTRFQQEISGKLGEFWMNHAKKEVERAVAQANELGIIDEDGAIKWKTNGSYIPDDFCEKLEYAGYNFSREATRIAREEQNKKFFEEYKKNQSEPTEEEIEEMRAVFGRGKTIVDVISGREIVL